MSDTKRKIDDRTIEELKGFLLNYADKNLTRSYKAGRNAYVCPFCGSGTKRKNTGAFKIFDDGRAWHCLNCGKGGDIYKLIELYEGETNFIEQVKIAADVAAYNLDFDDYTPAPKTTAPKEEKKPVERKITPGRYADYINGCHAAINSTDYFYKRGFSEETINRFNLGYDEAKQAVVIPYDPAGSYYITRDIKTNPNSGDHQFRKPGKEEAGEEPIFNSAALYENLPCFVCESPIDAISIIEAAGGSCNAVALGGTGHTKLINAVKARRPECMLILNFDNDEAGENAAERTAADLDGLSIDYIKALYYINSYPGETKKDANDLLRADKEQFIKDITYNIDYALSDQQKIINQYKASNFLADLKEEKEQGPQRFRTGFHIFDYELDGGLFPGLYILGAISSMGKTSFILQMADQMAKQGQHVLFFTLEMGAKELIAKSISRYSFLESRFDKSTSLTARQIMTPEKRKTISDEQREQLENAMDMYYLEVANKLWFYESLGDIGIEEIKAEIERHIKLTGEKPIVFIDYLQIMKPIDEVWTEKRNIDKIVLELKKLTRRFEIPIIAVSSLNRSSYKGDIEMDAFKESGAIEYGSDVLLGLQAADLEAGTNAKEAKANKEKIEKAKQQERRKIEIKVLKNRSGRTGTRISADYHAMFNYFLELDARVKTFESKSAEDVF